ncbi:MAG: hypothetical protein K6G48_07170 [Acholeplasmatales bacterium]|nr:hypothetical protein [Acholeplasmatales bacterium]
MGDKKVYISGTKENYKVETVEGGRRTVERVRGMTKPNLIAAIVLCSLFIIAGLFLMVTSICTKTTATITDKEQTEYSIEYSLEYTYKDDRYSAKLKSKESYSVGDEITIYVHLLQPENVSQKNSITIGVVALVSCGGFGILGIVLVLKGYKKHKLLLQSIGDTNHDGEIDNDDLDTIARANNYGNRKTLEELTHPNKDDEN